MDASAFSLIFQQLLASAGLKATLAIMCAGGVLLGVYKGANGAMEFFERMIANRDQMLSSVMTGMAASELRRAEFEKETAAIFATMRATMDAQLLEARDTRKEMHQRFNKLQEDATIIKGAVSSGGGGGT